jgi:ribosomal protein L40E
MTDSDLEIIFPDDETILVCPKCYTNNPEGSNFCLNCGFSLRKSSSDRKKWMWLFISVLLFIAAMFYFHLRLSNLRPHKAVRQPVPSVAQAQPKETTKAEAPPKEPPPPKNEEVSPVSSSIKIPLGLVVIKDITGKVINEVQWAAVG